MQIKITGPQKMSEVEIQLPASKSISNRLLIMKELSVKEIKINNLSSAYDTLLMQDLLQQIRRHSQEKSPEILELNAGNTGTVYRFLLAVLARLPGRWLLTGSERMKERPIAALCEALEYLGAEISFLEKPGFPPVLIQGKTLKGGSVSIDASKSSQFVSALLMIAPLMEEGLKLELPGAVVSEPYISMTLSLMQQAGVAARRNRNIIAVKAGSYCKSEFEVEPDWSAASYFYEIAALMPGARFLLKGLSILSTQGDVVARKIFCQLGVKTTVVDDSLLITNQGSRTGRFEFDFTACPDLVPAVAATCAGLGIEARLSGLQNLIIKESNRLSALKNELQKIHPAISVENNNVLHFKAARPVTSENTVFDTYDDHRMAMALAPMALLNGQVIVRYPEVVNKSYPSFWADLEKSGFTVEKMC